MDYFRTQHWARLACSPLSRTVAFLFTERRGVGRGVKTLLGRRRQPCCEAHGWEGSPGVPTQPAGATAPHGPGAGRPRRTRPTARRLRQRSRREAQLRPSGGPARVAHQVDPSDGAPPNRAHGFTQQTACIATFEFIMFYRMKTAPSSPGGDALVIPP